MRFAPTHKLATHKELVDYLNGKPIPPINVEVSLTGRCNANCTWCFYRGNKHKEDIDYGAVLKMLDELSSAGTKAITWTGGGEPTLHSRFNEILDYCKSIGLKQGLFTNALDKINYNPKIFEWIRVSKTNYDWDEDNIKRLRECKTLGMCINYIGNDKDVKEALGLAHKLGVDYVQVRPALNGNGEKTFINPPEITDDFLRITDYKFKEARKDRTYELCEGYHFVPFVWEDGNVSVCAYHRDDKKFTLGSIYKDSIMDILMNAPESVKVIPTCQICCKNHEINKFVSELRKLKDADFV